MPHPRVQVKSKQCRHCGLKTIPTPLGYFANMDVKLIFKVISEDDTLDSEVRSAADFLAKSPVGDVEPHLENYQWSLVHHSPSGAQTKVGDL